MKHPQRCTNILFGQYIRPDIYCRSGRNCYIANALVTYIFLVLFSTSAYAQPGKHFSPTDLKKLSFEDLMNLEVTSVSKTPEKLTEVASAIQVITSEDIARSPATRLPEALRLATNLQVAQSNAHDWAITARGFNGAPLSTNTLANKLLVMVDGRTIYTPLFGGVLWDVQNVLLEDIDRIEVVSGPGGTLWGANAVNGVINVISKTASETQGLYVSETLGSLLQDHIAVRYGGRLDSGLHYRVYGQRFDHRNTRLPTRDAVDKWNTTQGGFRMDYDRSAHNRFSLQGDLYGGKEDSAVTDNNGQNLSATWNHFFSERSQFTLQAYFDRTYRKVSFTQFKQELETYDLDLQHHFAVGNRHKMIWGAGYRVNHDNISGPVGTIFTPESRTLHLFNAFIQDQFALVPRKLELTVGTKLSYNDYTEFDWQPSIRLAWVRSAHHTAWGAVSRAVRTPSRLDVDVTTLAVPGNQPFKSEELTAYELGYRFHSASGVSLSLASFYNKYDKVRSIDSTTTTSSGFIFLNNQVATTWGFELSASVFIRTWWRLRGGYTYLHEDFRSTASGVVPGSDLLEAQDPANQVLLQSVMDLPKNFQFDLFGRYVDIVPAFTPVASYFSLDARLAWAYRRFTFSIVGRNLLQDEHTEFGTHSIPRSIYQKITFRL